MKFSPEFYSTIKGLMPHLQEAAPRTEHPLCEKQLKSICSIGNEILPKNIIFYILS